MNKKLYAKAEESVKSAKVILDDMRTNRSHYNATDLAWRCLDINLILVEVMGMVLKVIKPEKKSDRPSRQELVDEIVEEEKLDVEEQKPLSDEDKEKKEKGPDILNPDEKLDAKKKGKKKSSVKPSRPRVVKGNKKKG